LAHGLILPDAQTQEMRLAGDAKEKGASGSNREAESTDAATCGTIRLKLLKIGAIVRISVRRIKIAMASACPVAQDWACAAILLTIAALARASPA
jgi:hypothetical protein